MADEPISWGEYGHRRKFEFDSPEATQSAEAAQTAVENAKIPSLLKEGIRVMMRDDTRSPHLKNVLMSADSPNVIAWLEEVYSKGEADLSESILFEEGRLRMREHPLFKDPKPLWSPNKVQALEHRRQKHKGLFSINASDVVGRRNELEVYLRHIHDDLMEDAVMAIQKTMEQAGVKGVPFTMRLKGLRGIVEKLHRKTTEDAKYALGDMTDIMAGRIIVPSLRELAALDAKLTQYLKDSGKLIERDNRYGQPQDSTYRAINYLFDAGDGMIAELQIKTAASALGSGLDHNIVYKRDIYPNVAEGVRRAVADFSGRMILEDMRAA